MLRLARVLGKGWAAHLDDNSLASKFNSKPVHCEGLRVTPRCDAEWKKRKGGGGIAILIKRRAHCCLEMVFTDMEVIVIFG